MSSAISAATCQLCVEESNGCRVSQEVLVHSKSMEAANKAGTLNKLGTLSRGQGLKVRDGSVSCHCFALKNSWRFAIFAVV